MMMISMAVVLSTKHIIEFRKIGGVYSRSGLAGMGGKSFQIQKHEVGGISFTWVEFLSKITNCFTPIIRNSRLTVIDC